MRSMSFYYSSSVSVFIQVSEEQKLTWSEIDMPKLKYTTKEIKEKIFELTGNEYEMMGEYVNSRTKIKIKHVACGHEYMVRWNSFQQGVRCPKCAILVVKNKLAFTNEDIVKAMYELVGDEYTKMDENYTNNQTKFKIRHNTCGNTYEVNWNNFQSGIRCPKCNQSKGEKFIEDYLTNKGISFATQVRFSDCRYKNTLPFDFGIIDDNKRVICLVEYDGEQHFEPIEAWGGEEAFKERQRKDLIKTNYCKENNIPLLRIKYDENTEEKLFNFLVQY